MKFFIHPDARGVPGAVLKGVVLTLALFFLYSVVPFLGGAAGILIPFPCIFFSLKYGRMTGLAVVALMLGILAALDVQAMMLYLLQSVPGSLLLPEFLLRNKGGAGSILNTVAAHAVILIAAATLYGIFVTADIDAQVRGFIHAEIAQVMEMYRQVGVSGDELAGLDAAFSQVETVTVRIYPALILVSLALAAGINLMVLQKFSAFLGKEISFGRLSAYRNPDFVVWLLIIPGFALLTGNPLVERIALNLLAVTVFLYIVQGVAIVIWFSRKIAVPRFIMWLFYLLLLLQPVFAVMVGALGLIDLWADFRAPGKNKNL